jgi:hypothetical protein
MVDTVWRPVESLSSLFSITKKRRKAFSTPPTAIPEEFLPIRDILCQAAESPHPNASTGDDLPQLVKPKEFRPQKKPLLFSALVIEFWPRGE